MKNTSTNIVKKKWYYTNLSKSKRKGKSYEEIQALRKARFLKGETN